MAAIFLFWTSFFKLVITQEPLNQLQFALWRPLCANPGSSAKPNKVNTQTNWYLDGTPPCSAPFPQTHTHTHICFIILYYFCILYSVSNMPARCLFMDWTTDRTTRGASCDSRQYGEGLCSRIASICRNQFLCGGSVPLSPSPSTLTAGEEG